MRREFRKTLGFTVAIGALALGTTASAQNAADLPPNAKAGECYARIFVPAEYTTEVEQVLKHGASERIEIVPASYEWAQEQVLVQEASSKLVPIPATYETISETVEIEAAHTVWRLGNASKPKVADDGFLKAASSLGLPLASAQPGQCFEERVTDARFENREERVVKSQASSRVEIVPARFEWVEEQVLVKEAGHRIVAVPATYENQSEQLLVKPAHQIWKKGRGLIEKVSDATGEVMCLVEVPAEYKTVTKRVQTQPATTKRIEIPAEYKMVKVRKMAAPASENRIEIPAEYQLVSKRSQVSGASRLWAPLGSSEEGRATGQRLCLAEVPARTKTLTRQVERTAASSERIEIPASYETVKVRKLVTPARERRIEIPAEYQTVAKRRLVRDGELSWRAVLCETNSTPQLITQIQRALKSAGHNPGKIDGVVGRDTVNAMRAFQISKGLPTGGITMATLDALGVRN